MFIRDPRNIYNKEHDYLNKQRRFKVDTIEMNPPQPKVLETNDY